MSTQKKEKAVEDACPGGERGEVTAQTSHVVVPWAASRPGFHPVGVVAVASGEGGSRATVKGVLYLSVPSQNGEGVEALSELAALLELDA